MKTLVRIFFMISLLGTVAISNAADTEIFSISNTACDENRNCSVQLYNGRAVGPNSCSSVYLHWDGNTVAGENMHSIALAAVRGGHYVIISFDPTNCYSLIGSTRLRPQVTAITVVRHDDSVGVPSFGCDKKTAVNDTYETSTPFLLEKKGSRKRGQGKRGQVSH